MTTTRRLTKRSDWLLDDPSQPGGTVAGSVVHSDIATDTTRTVSTILTTQADELRYRARTLNQDIDGVAQQTYLNEWQVRTQQQAARSPLQLLDALSELGFAWRDIARLVGVSVPAIQKWRKGGSTSPDSRSRLAGLLAGCDLIERHRPIDDIGQWFDMPMLHDVPVTPADLWTAGHYPLAFEYALAHMSAETVLDRFDAEWRDRYRTDFETFRGEDGHLGIRVRAR